MPGKMCSDTFACQNQDYRQRYEHAQAQIGKGIVVSVDLILRGKQVAVEGSVDACRIPQGIKVHGKIPVQCLTAAGGSTVEKAEQPSQPQRTEQIGSKIQAGTFPLALLCRMLQQQGQGDPIGHGQKVGMDSDGCHIEHE